MFNGTSRYGKLNNATVTDAQGRTLNAKAVRLLPETGETFPYTVTETDRLDHLGYRAFRKSRQWWRVCDANPGSLHPQDLIGKSTVRLCVIKLVPDDDRVLPNWNDFLGMVRALQGVEAAVIEEAVDLQPDSTVTDPEDRKMYLEEHFSALLFVAFNSMNTDNIDLYHEIASAAAPDVTVSVPEIISRTGKEISIPGSRSGG